MRRPEHETNLALRCPNCKYGRSLVVDSRDIAERKARRRRHQCERCDTRFTTYEITAAAYERMRALQCGAEELDKVVAFLRAVKVQIGETNGHR